MKILYLAGRELSYSRNDVLLRAFQRFSQVDIVGVRQRPASLILNSLWLTFKAFPKLAFGQYDIIFVGFYGHFLMLPVGIFARQPVIFDAFVSTYDTLGSDRRVISTDSLAGRLAFWLDRTACRLAKRVLLDTPLHVAYFSRTFELPIEKFLALPVGCNEDIFSPQPQTRAGPPTEILYYSSYMPLHGVETVIKAAAQLKGEAVHFRLIGEGQEYARARSLAEKHVLQNIEFIPSVALTQLPQELAEADICLGGHFGKSDKADRVVPGKIYQILAMGRPLIAGDTHANRDLLTEGENALLCPPGDADALTQAILKLHTSPSLREQLSVGARALYLNKCSEALITRQLYNLCV